MKKQYPLIDAVKFICAFLVVFIHTFEAHDGHPAAVSFLTLACSQAVPVFFVASGFFFSKKMLNSGNIRKDTINYIKPLLIVYVVWTLLWLPDTIIMYKNMYPDKSVLYQCMLVIRRDLFAGYGVYWYILVFVESAIVLSLFIRFKKERFLYILAFIGLVWGIVYEYDVNLPVIQQLHSLIYTVFSWSNNVIMKGIPFTVLGYVLAKYYRKPIPLKVLFPMYIAVVGISAVVYYLTGKECNPFVGAEAFLIMAMLIREAPEAILKKKDVFSELRNMSSAFYVTHPVIIYLVIDKIWGVEFNLALRYLFAIIGCMIIYFLAKAVKLKPINKLLMIK